MRYLHISEYVEAKFSISSILVRFLFFSESPAGALVQDVPRLHPTVSRLGRLGSPKGTQEDKKMNGWIEFSETESLKIKKYIYFPFC